MPSYTFQIEYYGSDLILILMGLILDKKFNDTIVFKYRNAIFHLFNLY